MPIKINLDWNRNETDNYLSKRRISNGSHFRCNINNIRLGRRNSSRRGTIEETEFNRQINKLDNFDTSRILRNNRNIDIDSTDFNNSISNNTSSSFLSNDNEIKIRSDSPIKYANEMLDAHNKFRSQHGVPPLKLCVKLTQFAQEWADELAESESFYHREPNDYGENLYSVWGSGSDFYVDGVEPVESWYSEIKDYEFGYEPMSMGTGHFTQLIWRESRKLGVGKASSSSGKVYIVANYDPPGNFVGSYSDNVPPPINSSKFRNQTHYY